MIDIRVKIPEKTTRVVSALARVVGEGDLMRELSVTAEAFTNRWYANKADYFDNPSSPTHGAGRRDTKWALKLASGWQRELTGDGFSVIFSPQEGNAVGSFLTHIEGRTITARGRFLTIPMQPKAHGLRAREFERVENVRLFRPRIKGGTKNDRKSYLAYSLGKGRGISVAYLLRKSVTIKSLKERTGRDPLPTEQDYQEPLNTAAESYISRILKQ